MRIGKFHPAGGSSSLACGLTRIGRSDRPSAHRNRRINFTAVSTVDEAPIRRWRGAKGKPVNGFLRRLVRGAKEFERKYTFSDPRVGDSATRCSCGLTSPLTSTGMCAGKASASPQAAYHSVLYAGGREQYRRRCGAAGRRHLWRAFARSPTVSDTCKTARREERIPCNVKIFWEALQYWNARDSRYYAGNGGRARKSPSTRRFVR